MIDLNEFSSNGEEKEVKIFNNGDAGRVTDVSVSVKKKSAEDKPNSPDYKVFFKDENGEMNEGFYYIKEGDNSPKFKLGRIINIVHAVNPETVGVEFPKFPDYKEATDFLMKKIHEGASKGNKVNIFVAYGNEAYPKQYLTLRGINFIENANKDENTTRLKPVASSDPEKAQYNDVMSRPQPDSNTQSDDVFGSTSPNEEVKEEVDNDDFF